MIPEGASQVDVLGCDYSGRGLQELSLKVRVLYDNGPLDCPQGPLRASRSH